MICTFLKSFTAAGDVREFLMITKNVNSYIYKVKGESFTEYSLITVPIGLKPRSDYIIIKHM